MFIEQVIFRFEYDIFTFKIRNIKVAQVVLF